MNQFSSISIFKLASKTLTVVAISLCALTACNKSGDGASSSNSAWYETELAKRMPKGAVGFMVWEASRPGYDKYKKEVLDGMDSQGLLGSLDSFAGSEETKNLTPVLDALKKSGIIPTGDAQADLFSSGVIFLTSSDKLPMAYGAYVKAATNINLEEKFSALQKLLESEGRKLEKKPAGSTAAGFSFAIKEPADAPFGKVYISYSKDLMSISSDSAISNALFEKAGDSGLAEIVGKDSFKKAVAQLGNVSEQFTFGYADAKLFAKAVFGSVPAEAKVGSTFSPDQVPFEAFAFGRAMKDTVSDSILLTTSPGTENGKKLLDALKTSGKLSNTTSTPDSALFSLAVDGATVNRIKDFALSELAPEQKAGAEKDLAILSDIKNIAIGVLQSSGGSPFPGVLLLADSLNPSSLTTAIDTQVNQALASGGMPLGPWQTKDIAGNSVKYLQSPMGVGLFLSQTKEGVLVASSEEVISSVIKTKSGETKSLSSSLPASAKANLEGRNNFVTAYVNFSGIGSLIESAQGTLAMFTGGGASPQMNSSIERLKKMGSVTVAAGLDNDSIRLQSDYILAPKG